MQEEKKVNNFEVCKDDEIDLYEIVATLLRHKKTIIFSFIMLMLLSFASAFYIKYNHKDVLAQNLIAKKSFVVYTTNSDNTTLNFTPRELFRVDFMSYEDLLFSNKIVKKFFENKELKAYFLANTAKENANSLEFKREFLSNIISFSVPKATSAQNKESAPQKVLVKVSFVSSKSLQKYLLRTFVSSFLAFNNEMLNNKLTNNIKAQEDSLNKSQAILNKLNAKIDNIVSKHTKLSPLEVNTFLNTRYPNLVLKKQMMQKDFENVGSNLIQLRSAKVRNVQVVDITSSQYLLIKKSKTKLILAIGFVLSIILSIFFAFIKEFIDEYKRRKKSGDLI